MAMIDRESLQQLVDDFADCTIQHTECLRQQDARKGNVHARRQSAIFHKLREIGDPGREALSTLFVHERDDVRAMAATHLLRYKTEEALEVLRNVAATGTGLAAFGAEQAIERWKDGDWNLDPP